VKLKLDENLPASLVQALASLGHDVDTVPAEGLAGRADADVWRAAQGEARLLVTQDLDFSDARRFAPGSHHGILLVRLRAPGRLALADAVLALFGPGGRRVLARLSRGRRRPPDPHPETRRRLKSPRLDHVGPPRAARRGAARRPPSQPTSSDEPTTSAMPSEASAPGHSPQTNQPQARLPSTETYRNGLTREASARR
jgi:hypothetical protein